MFRAEFYIHGDTPREQRLRIADALRQMAGRVELDSRQPLAGSQRITISDKGKLLGEGRFEIGLGRLVA